MHVTADSESCNSCTGRRSAFTSPSRRACFMALVPFSDGLSTPMLPRPPLSAAPPNHDFMESITAETELLSPALLSGEKASGIPSSGSSMELSVMRAASMRLVPSMARPLLRTAMSLATIMSHCIGCPWSTFHLLPKRTTLAPAAFTSFTCSRAESRVFEFDMSYTMNTHWERPNHSFTKCCARLLPEQSRTFRSLSPTWIWWWDMRFSFWSLNFTNCSGSFSLMSVSSRVVLPTPSAPTIWM
mmetsp:Transcript_14878/g.38196  ORF Transcript_14878/g.38196 Transcript_14878/m.38196 type:complete len:243 (+) Transcript_14878:99-827(+)